MADCFLKVNDWCFLNSTSERTSACECRLRVKCLAEPESDDSMEVDDDSLSTSEVAHGNEAPEPEVHGVALKKIFLEVAWAGNERNEQK